MARGLRDRRERTGWIHGGRHPVDGASEQAVAFPPPLARAASPTPMRIALLFLPFVATGLSAQLTCKVNDTRSHGAIGDTKLSFDEAIRVINGTLAITALSNTEQAQFAGLGSVLEEIHLDPALTPTITLERVLTDVIGQPHAHAHVELLGAEGPNGEHVVIDAGTLPVGLPLRTNHAHVHGLVIRGGQIGVDYDTLPHYHPLEVGELGEVRCEGQSAIGIRVTNAASPVGQQAPLTLHDVHVHGAPIGLQIRDSSVFGNIHVDAEHLQLEHCGVGIDVDIQSNGGDHLLAFRRGSITHASTGVRVRRTAASSARWQFLFVQIDVAAMMRAVDVEGNAASTTVLGLHHVVASGGVMPGDHALRIAPRDGAMTLRVTESTLSGDIQLALNPGNNGLLLAGNHLRNGTATVDLGGGSGLVQWSTLTSLPCTVSAANTGVLTFDGCEFVRSPLANSAPATIAVRSCYLASSPTTGAVTVQNALTAPWIGRATVSPKDPPLGGFVDLNHDLPAGIAAIWLLGVADSNPNVFANPFRFYLDLTAYVQLPGVVINQGHVRISVPMNMSLRGRAFYAQPVQAPINGQPFVPTPFLPVGGGFGVEH